jgi:1-acyl-sn-glycerol-3-phosphate acyltransferase
MPWQGESTLLYPGGVREAFKSTKRGEAYQLFWPEEEGTSDFARVAARFNATIVPVAAIGAEDGFDMLLDADEILSLPFLGERAAEAAKRTPAGRPGERFVSPLSVPKVPGRYYFLFGAPIETSAVSASDKDACEALYAEVKAELETSLRYLLEKRDADPWEAALPRAAVEATWGWQRQAPTFKL